MSAQLEVKYERDQGFVISDGTADSSEFVRVRYRPVGGRRWTKFLLVPDEDQSLEELEENAELAAESHYALAAVSSSGEATTESETT